MILDENWAVDPGRVRDFFAQLPGAVETPEGFIIEDCRVTLIPVESSLFGKWPMKRTRILLDGPETAVNDIYRKFFLRFLSAGG